MPGFRRKKIIIFIIIALVLFSIPVFIYLLRSPVLIVGDLSFERLYGPMRLRQMNFQVSRELLRRVLAVSVAETSGPDLLTIAVEGAAKSPGAVLFPSRYVEGARYYKDKYPETPVFVIGEAIKGKTDTGLVFVRTNTEEDLYRAGLCAAFLAGENKVLYFGETSLPDRYWNVFKEGLKEQGYEKDPVFINISSDFSSFSDIGCVVLAGAASKFLERNLKIPIILFSWVDPVMTPRMVKVVFDDSPWALAPLLFKASSPTEEEILLSSMPMVLPGRIEEKGDFRKIQGIIKRKYQKK